MISEKGNVAIIGGGPSGLVSAKSLLECGFVPTIFEKNSDFGGNWSRSNTKPWDSLKTNVSKYSCCFSDFPHEQDNIDENNLFLKQSEVYDYLYRYAKKFNLLECIKNNCNVTKVSRVIKNPNDNNQDKWKIEWVDFSLEQSNIQEKVFDFVIIASGTNSKPAKFEQIELLDKFNGRVIHSKDYKSPDSYKDKRVLMIGNAFSGSQIATELTNYSKSVHQVVRRKNQWVLPDQVTFTPPPAQSGEVHAPLDFIFYVRKQSYDLKKLPIEGYHQFLNNTVKFLTKDNLNLKEFQYDSNKFNIPPYFIIANNNYLPLVKNEKIQIIRNYKIESVNGNEITMRSNDNPDLQEKFEFDEIILSNGYHTDLTFLDKEIQDEINYITDDYYVPCLLHKNVFPKNLKNIGFVGIINTPFFNTLELMSRWVALVFSGVKNFPSDEEIEKGIQKQFEIRHSEESVRYQFPYIDPLLHGDDLANEIDCLPDFDEIKSNDPELYDNLMNVFYCNACYRLNGPFSKPELSKKTLNQYKNIYQKVMTPK